MQSVDVRAENQIMHVVVLGADSPIGLSLIRDLGRKNFRVIALGSEEDSIGLSSRYCDLPLIRQQDPAALIEQLLTIGQDNQPIALLAISESDIKLLNKHRSELSKHYSLLFADAEMMAVALDKVSTARLAQTLGIDCPKSWQIQGLSDLDALNHEFVFPLVLKWANPHEVANDLRRAGLPLEKLEYCLDIKMLTEKLSRYEVIGQYPLIQRYYAGHGLGQFFLCDRGQVLMQFQHERIHEWPPEGGVSTLCRSLPLEQHQACTSRSAQLLASIGWVGVAMVEYRYCPASHRYVLMEINGRFWGSTPLALASGVGFASGLVDALALHKKVTQPRIRLRYCRYMVPEIRRIGRLLFDKKSIKDPNFQYHRVLELLKFLAYFFNPFCRYYVFNLDDPKPLFIDLRHILKKLLNR